ncbi:protein ABHD13-like isoform X2 [Apostichopus japonicus]|uniref:protein ABHD13-like isoform X2 n=1 Tax=Stichopus japonicus TaxID=307972 RepID=UPI003AB651FD
MVKQSFHAVEKTNIEIQAEDLVPLIEEDTPSSKKGSEMRGCRTIVKDVLGALIHTIWGWSGPGTLIAVLCYYHLGGGVLLFLIVFITCLGLLYNGQDLLLYYPDQPDSSRVFVPSPSVVGIHSSQYENIFIQTADNVNINALLMKQAPSVIPLVPTILFFHGNAGNIGHRLINAAIFHSLCHCNVLLVEYRGYGKSDGDPYEEGMYKDAQAALDYLHNRSDINSNFIFVFGRSLGGAVAIDLASKPRNRGKIRGLILENTFTSIPDMGRHLFRLDLIKWIPLFIVKNKRCGGAKKMAVFENGSHNDTWQRAGYCETVKDFLNRYSGVSKQPSTSGQPVEPPSPLATTPH